MDMGSIMDSNMDISIDNNMESSEDNCVDSTLGSSIGNDSGSADESSTDDNCTDDNCAESSNVDDINMDEGDVDEGDVDHSNVDDSDMDDNYLSTLPLFMADMPHEDRALAARFMEAVDWDASPETISALMKDKPELLLEQCDEDDDWDFLLTYPIKLNYVRIKPLVAAFIRDNPELPSLRSSDGNTAMHVVAWCCRNGISIDILKLLSTPGAAQIQNDAGRTPLHLACSIDDEVLDDPSPEAIQFLLDLFPGAVRLADDEGMLPLHHICGNHLMEDVVTIERLIRHYPESLSVRDKSGNLPLHYACKQRVASSCIIAMLLELHPQSVYAKGQGGSTVLHCVCNRIGYSNDERRDKIDAKLLDLFPDALDMLDDKGRTPLMVYCSSFGNEPAVSGATLKRMIDVCRNAARRFVEGGFTALHYLCEKARISRHFSFEFSIHLVLDAWPLALAIYGQTKGICTLSASNRCLPYGIFAESNYLPREMRIAIADHLERETEAVFVACAESVLHGGFRYKNVKEHFRGMIARYYNDINLTTSSSFVIARAIQARGCCSHTVWQAVFDDSDFQSLAKEDVGFQNLVCGLSKMNKKAACGRDYDGNVPVVRQLMLLEEVIDNLDCIYVHLRECPSLFFKDRDPVPEAPLILRGEKSHVPFTGSSVGH